MIAGEPMPKAVYERFRGWVRSLKSGFQRVLATVGWRREPQSHDDRQRDSRDPDTDAGRRMVVRLAGASVEMRTSLVTPVGWRTLSSILRRETIRR